MMSYAHLSEYERKVIKKMQSEGKSQNQIAKHLGRHRSTICRELKRNKEDYWYRAPIAHQKSVERRKNSKKRKLDTNSKLREHVIEKLKERIAPDAISGRLKLTHKDFSDMQISHEAIYTWIYDKALKGNDLYKYLPRGVKKRNRRLNKKKSRLTIPNRVSIHERPKEVEERKEIGHWEGGTISGKRGTGYIATSVDRKSLFLVAGFMKNKEKYTCNRALFEAYGDIPNESIKTITFDNGTEFYAHEDLKEMFECETFFADPYSPWQRGLNEHTNGLLRRFFKKGMSFENLTQKDVDEAVMKLNNMPRKSLGYRTPYEEFYNINVALQT